MFRLKIAGQANDNDTMAILYANENKVGEGSIEHTQRMIFSVNEAADIGIDLATSVVETIAPKANLYSRERSVGLRRRLNDDLQVRLKLSSMKADKSNERKKNDKKY